MRWAYIFLLTLAVLAVGALARASTSVENLGSIAATVVRTGLGFNVDLEGEWEFQMMAACGATEARFQPGWSSVENMAGVLALPANDEKSLGWCKTYGIKPLLVAGYGPPFQSLGKFTVADDVPIGATSIKLNQSVEKIVVPYCHVMAGRKQIVQEGKWGYYGALIAGVDQLTNTITLASKTTIALAAGDPLVINRLLYPSCATGNPTDPSIVAYAKYANFLAEQIASHGLMGRVELWNEPGWAHDPWDHRGGFYDKPPDGITAASPNFGIAEHLALTTLPSGVRYNWGGTNKSGGRSVLNPAFMKPPITAEEVKNSIACEAMHPYGDAPETHMWDPTVLASVDIHQIGKATLPGTSNGSNMKFGRWMNLQNLSLNFQQNITETGAITADNVRKARHITRQYLGYLADGLERCTFFCFAAPDAGKAETFGFVDETTKAPTQAYTAIKGLVVDDMAAMPIDPVKYAASDLPSVLSYGGTYPLAIVSIVGRHAQSDTRNAIYFVAWQRSHAPPGPVKNLAVASITTMAKLTWQKNDYAVDSTLERATVSGGPYTVIAPHLDRTFYFDRAITPGTTYFYIVLGNNPAGASSASNEVSVTPSASAKDNGSFNDNTRAAGPAQIPWLSLPSPPAAKITVRLPQGYRAIRGCDLVTRDAVPVAVADGSVTYWVSDNPVGLMIEPATDR